MALENYMKRNEISVKQASDELDVSPSYLYKILAGERELGPKLAARIVIWSGHDLTFDELYGEIISEESKRVVNAE